MKRNSAGHAIEEFKGFHNFLAFCIPSRTEYQSESAISVAAEFGFDVVVVGPTGTTTDDATGSAPATISDTITVYITPTASSSHSPSSTATSSPEDPTNRVWIAGAVIDPVVFILILVIGGFFLRRRRKREKIDLGSTIEHGWPHAKPELHGKDIRQVAPVELEGQRNVCANDLVELPASHHGAASELPGHEKEVRNDDDQDASDQNGGQAEEDTARMGDTAPEKDLLPRNGNCTGGEHTSTP